MLRNCFNDKLLSLWCFDEGKLIKNNTIAKWYNLCSDKTISFGGIKNSLSSPIIINTSITSNIKLNLNESFNIFYVLESKNDNILLNSNSLQCVYTDNHIMFIDVKSKKCDKIAVNNMLYFVSIGYDKETNSWIVRHNNEKSIVARTIGILNDVIYSCFLNAKLYAFGMSEKPINNISNISAFIGIKEIGGSVLSDFRLDCSDSKMLAEDNLEYGYVNLKGTIESNCSIDTIDLTLEESRKLIIDLFGDIDNTFNIKGRIIKEHLFI